MEKNGTVLDLEAFSYLHGLSLSFLLLMLFSVYVSLTNPSEMIRFATLPPTFFKHISGFTRMHRRSVKKVDH